MEMLKSTVFGVVALLLITFGPAVAAFVFLTRRKRLARLQRRSPLTADLLRSPGMALREQLDDLRTDVAFDMALLLFIPLLPLGLFHLMQWFGSVLSTPVVAVCLMGSTLAAAWMIRSLLQRSARMDRLRLGLDAELAVGQELDHVMRQGAVVFHDLPAEKFNIDHVVIAPQGVFAVETKGYSKPQGAGGTADAKVVYDGRLLAFPGWTSSRAIEQAERQARWLSDWLARATGEPVSVTPVLALPGWFIERTGRGVVQVLSGKEIQRNLLTVRQAQPLERAQMQRIVHQVEQRCRNAAPHYRPDDG